MMEVTDQSGHTHVTPQLVKQTVTEYYEQLFSDDAAPAWYQDPKVGEGVRVYFEDSRRGREAREAGLRGVFHPDWEGVEQDTRDTIKRMVAFKKTGVGDSIEEREQAFEEVMDPITETEWEQEWAKKSAYTSGGKSGVRPDMVKGCGPAMRQVMLRLYNACLALNVIPDQWRAAILVAIEKVAGDKRVDKLRPLKLLEVAQKGVVSIVKGRMRDKLEEMGLLHGAQNAFRAERYTGLSTMALLNAAEAANSYRQDLHVVLLDISRKAYDSVVRTLGKAAALRRMGIPAKVVDFVMELDRENTTAVRTFWDVFLEGSVEEFEAQRGLAQGSADAPLLWIIFYDMVICELIARGVGTGARVHSGTAVAVSSGLSTFADDTAIMHTSWEGIQRSLQAVDSVLRVVMLRLAPEKSVHMALWWDTTGPGRLMKEDLVNRGIQHRLTLRGVEVPWVEADVGARHLGYWVDLVDDWGEQIALVEGTIADFKRRICPKRMSPAMVLYAVEAVLTPRVIYPLTLAAVSAAQIDALESKVLGWVLPKLGLRSSYARRLVGSERGVGGLGWVRWHTRVALARRRLATDLCYHSDPSVRLMWWSLRARHYDQSQSDRRTLGGGRTTTERSIEGKGEPNSVLRG